MSLLEIIKLVGFATGAALHLYIAWLIWQRRLGSRKNLNQVERAFIVLGLCLGVWFIGNLFITLHELVLTRERLTAALRVWDAITTIGVALLPAALLHAHLAFYSMLTNYRRLSPRQVTLAAFALYAPMFFLPYAVYLIATGPYESFLIKLRPLLLLPYSIWFLVALWSAAVIDWKIKDHLDPKATRERAFFKRLALVLVFNGAFEFYVVAVARSGPDDLLWIVYVLLGLLPTFLVAYHVYRYKFVDVAIKDSLVYAAFAVVFIAIYTYGIRRLDEMLVARVGATPGVVEAILILGMFVLAGPLVRLMDRAVQRLFAREFGLYRDVVRRVSTGAAGFGELNSLVLYTQETIRQGLDLAAVRIIRFDELMPEGPERRIARKMIQWKADIVEANEDLALIDATAAYALRREGELIGMMIVTSEQALTSEKRAILDVLAGQVAIELEAGRLVDEKVQLERKLAHRERLATLGQMAATVAHEVKNPLSSIKSIAQVMREDPGLADYDRDLSLIVSEIDRLNRTVSQLLAFSRPSHADAHPVSLREMIGSTIALLGNDARESGVKLSAEAVEDVTLTGSEASALREALSNLIINAIQAAGSSGEVRVEAGIESNRGTAKLTLSVTDTGPGIALDAQQRVFEPFYTTKSRGTGLGLAIVQRRATELGGVVDLTSPVANNYGTSFRMIVPLSTTLKKGPEVSGQWPVGDR